MGFKELRELLHEKDREFSSWFYKIDYKKDINGIKRISWKKIFLAWIFTIAISSLFLIPITQSLSNYSTNSENVNSDMESFKSFSNNYFSMDYPSNFTIKEDNSYIISFSGGLNNWIEVWRSSSSNSLSYEVAETRSNINSGKGKTLGSTKTIIVDGIQAYEIRALYPNNGGVITYILVKNNGNIFTLRFSGLIDDNTKNQIIDSFKFK